MAGGKAYAFALRVFFFAKATKGQTEDTKARIAGTGFPLRQGCEGQESWEYNTYAGFERVLTKRAED